MYGNSHYFFNSGLTLNLTLLYEQKLEQCFMLLNLLFDSIEMIE